jgi:phospholipid/cholesterol/gamma-HCH transport system substrate-binding protein
MGGVRIGSVTKITLDPSGSKAVVTMQINDRFNDIPVDSTAAIELAGLLGGEDVALDPGGSQTSLHEDGEIRHTKSGLLLETVIERLFAALAREGSLHKAS